MKRIFLCSCLALLGQQAFAQDAVEGSPETTKKPAGWEAGVAGMIRVDARAGLTGHLKYVLPTKNEKGNGFTITGKLMHIPPTDKNSEYSGIFDGTKSNNISAAFLMGGYRFNLTEKYNGKLFLDINAGFGWVTRKSPAVVINPTVQYSFSGNGRWFALAGVNMAFSNWADPNVIELGVVYKIK